MIDMIDLTNDIPTIELSNEPVLELKEEPINNERIVDVKKDNTTSIIDNNKGNNKGNNKSKKTRNEHINKAELWNMFDAEIINPDKKINQLECLYQTSVKTRNYCDYCNSSLLFSEEGFLTCTNTQCGIVYKDILDQSPEWRFYGSDDAHGADPARCGMPTNPLLDDTTFGCKVLCVNRTSTEMRKIQRCIKWISTYSYKEKTRYDTFQQITTYAHNAGISKKIIDDAIRYHKKISDYEKSFRGDNKDGLMAASIYISCRFNQCPRTAKEIASIFNLDVTSATHGCKNAQNILNILEQDMDNRDKTTFSKTKPENFIDRYCSKLNINRELTKLCKFIAIKIDKLNLMPENTPHSIAAGIVFFISQLCNLNVSKKDVKNISEISEVTIIKCCKKLEKMTSEIVPSTILEKYKLNK